MENKEKADLLNGMLNYLNDKGHLTDFDGKYNLKDDRSIRALKGLEENGYVNLTIAEESEEIVFVIITEYGKNWVNTGSLFK